MKCKATGSLLEPWGQINPWTDPPARGEVALQALLAHVCVSVIDFLLKGLSQR